MQSLSRQIKRGNAIIYFDYVTKKFEIQQRRNATGKQWRHALMNASQDAMDGYREGVTKPIAKAMMDEAKAKETRMVINN